jgi:pimeloyl-ACP methyl ester carboxylesterase
MRIIGKGGNMKLNQLGMAAIAAMAPVGGPPAQAAQASAAIATAPLAIDEGQFVEINGVEQWVTIRGRDPKNPVLLLLHGGPGFPMSFLAPLYAGWEEKFTIVQWDQPSTGGTYLKHLGKDVGPLTIDRYVHDGIAVAEWSRKRLGADKLVLLGTSWGSLLGIEMVARRPELFSAYVGTSQPVGAKGNLLGYELGLKAARERGDQAAADALTRVGPPPYSRFEDFMVRAQYTNPPAVPSTPAENAASGEMIKVMMSPDPAARYNAPLPPPQGYDGGFMAAQQATWKETWAWEVERLGTKFDVPILIVQGGRDLNTPAATAREWFDTIEAPKKVFELVPDAGHGVILFHQELFGLLEKHVLPVAAPSKPRR